MEHPASSILPPSPTSLTPTQTYIVKAADGLMLTEELGRRLAFHDLGLVLGRHGRYVL